VYGYGKSSYYFVRAVRAGQCGSFGDSDNDGFCDDIDNCPNTPNGPGVGTCTSGSIGDPCTIAGVNETECGTGGYCSMDQEDTDGDGLGDACDDCAVDEDCDDGIYCNGGEVCAEGVECQAGTNPCPDDGLYCNGVESCNEVNDQCESGADPCTSCSAINCICDDTVDHCVGCTADYDCDGTNDSSDNCPDMPNASQEDNYPCLSGGNCPGGNSSPPTDNCGDACECEGDVQSNSQGVGYPDGDVDGSDAFVFKQNFGRTNCVASPPCLRDHECDGDVDGSDAFKFKEDFGRSDCPDCDFECVY
jgi:hypothetical protein